MIAVSSWSPETVITPGFYDMPAHVYHADPCPLPSLNASVARLLAYKSPLHAQRAHPRLTKQPQRDTPSRDMCIGSAVHALALGKGAEIVEIPFDDYKKAAAQEARDTALGRHRIPVLTPDMEKVRAMADPMRNAVVRLVGEDHLAEVVGIAQDHRGSWQRIMVDAISRDGSIFIDCKTTVSSEPQDFAAHTFRMRYDFNEVFYRDVLEALLPGPRRFFLIAQERDVPEAITIHETDGLTREAVGQDVTHACDLWAQCMASNQWPAYQRGPHMISVPTWRMSEME